MGSSSRHQLHNLIVSDLPEIAVPLAYRPEVRGDQGAHQILDQRSDHANRLSGRDGYGGNQPIGTMRTDCLDRDSHRRSRGQPVIDDDHAPALERQVAYPVRFNSSIELSLLAANHPIDFFR